MIIGFEGSYQVRGQLFDAFAGCQLFYPLLIFGIDSTGDSGQTPGNGRDDIRFNIAEADGLHEFFKTDGRFALHGTGVGLVQFADTDAIDNNEMVLAF